MLYGSASPARNGLFLNKNLEKAGLVIKTDQTRAAAAYQLTYKMQSSGQVLPIGQTVMPIVVNTPPRSSVRVNYLASCVKGLSITQITLGSLAVVLQIGQLINHSPVAEVGAGIWTGILFILAGALGVVSSDKKTTCWIVWFLVMSIISAMFTTGLLSTSAIGWGFTSEYYSYIEFNGRASVVIYAILVIISIVEAIVAIVSSGYACHGLCCSDSQNGAVVMQGTVQYVTGPNGQAQIIITPAVQTSIPITNGQYVPPNPGYQMLIQPGQSAIQNPTVQPMPGVYHPAPVEPTSPPSYDRRPSPPPQYSEPTKEAL